MTTHPLAFSPQTFAHPLTPLPIPLRAGRRLASSGTAQRVGWLAPIGRLAPCAVPSRTSVAPEVPVPFVASGEETEMPRRTPATLAAVLALGDARLRIVQLLTRDGALDSAEAEALLLLDTAAYWGQRADLNRRERNSIEDHGEVVPRLLREQRELEDEYRHVPHDWRDAA